MRNQDVLLPEVVNILVIHWLPSDTMHYLRMDATTQKFCGTSPLTV